MATLRRGSNPVILISSMLYLLLSSPVSTIDYVDQCPQIDASISGFNSLAVQLTNVDQVWIGHYKLNNKPESVVNYYFNISQVMQWTDVDQFNSTNLKKSHKIDEILNTTKVKINQSQWSQFYHIPFNDHQLFQPQSWYVVCFKSTDHCAHECILYRTCNCNCGDQNTAWSNYNLKEQITLPIDDSLIIASHPSLHMTRAKRGNRIHYTGDLNFYSDIFNFNITGYEIAYKHVGQDQKGDCEAFFSHHIEAVLFAQSEDEKNKINARMNDNNNCYFEIADTKHIISQPGGHVQNTFKSSHSGHRGGRTHSYLHGAFKIDTSLIEKFLGEEIFDHHVQTPRLIAGSYKSIPLYDNSNTQNFMPSTSRSRTIAFYQPALPNEVVQDNNVPPTRQFKYQLCDILERMVNLNSDGNVMGGIEDNGNGDITSTSTRITGQLIVSITLLQLLLYLH